MRSAVVVADTRSPALVYGTAGPDPVARWVCLARRTGLSGGWEAVEWAGLPPGAAGHEHLHTRTEAVHVLLSGHGELTLDGRTHPVRAADAVLITVGTRYGLRNLGDRPLERLMIEIPARHPPLFDGVVITNLRRIGPLDPSVALGGPLRLLRVARLGAGERAEHTADGVEHTLFVAAGGGRAATGDVRVPVRPGTALTLPLGTSVTLTAGPDGLEYVHAVLAVPAAGATTEGSADR
ncbi:cupin domain-containing protein [Kitasatospora sp. NPDC004240]